MFSGTIARNIYQEMVCELPNQTLRSCSAYNKCIPQHSFIGHILHNPQAIHRLTGHFTSRLFLHHMCQSQSFKRSTSRTTYILPKSQHQVKRFLESRGNTTIMRIIDRFFKCIHVILLPGGTHHVFHYFGISEDVISI